MPYKNPKDKKRHDRLRYQLMRETLLIELGYSCVICGTTENLEIHHIKRYGQRSRPNSKEYFAPEGKELRCSEHHACTKNWRNRKTF